MNILHINTNYLCGGGAASIAKLLHNEINKKEGMTSKFLYGRGGANDPNAVKIVFDFESYISAAATRVFGSSLNRGLTKKAKTEIDNADIIHIHNLHGYYLNYESLINYIVEKDKKVVWTLHDTWAFTGRCAFTSGCEKWKYGCGNCKYLSVYPATKKDISDKLWIKKMKLFTRLNKEKTIFVSPSDWLKHLVEKSFLKDYKIEVINNGVEKSYILNIDKNELRKKLKLPLDKKIVLFVAADANDERKGIKYILDILDEIDESMVFISMGKKIELTSNKLIQLGYISNRKDIYEVYRASDVFVIPSLDDNFPTTVLEAFANGIPVIGFNTGGISEQICKNTGIVVSDISSIELKRSIICLLKDDKKLQYFSNSSIKKFLDYYTLDILISKYLMAYKKLGDEI